MVKNYETKWGKFKRSNLPWLLPIFVLSTLLLFFLSIVSPKDYPMITSIKQGATNVIKNIADPGIPEVIGANFDLNYKKVPYDTKYLEFTFSTELDPNSITGDVFTITPKVAGDLDLSAPNVLKYKLSERLEKGIDYNIIISNKIKSKKNKNLPTTLSYLVRTVDKAKVLQITPKGDLTSLDQKLRVFFNIPMISLSSIDNKKKNPCPIEIIPNINGTCKWLTNSVVEFEPNRGFQGASSYDVKVKKVDGIMYDFDEIGVTIYTPKLQITTPFSKYDNLPTFDVFSGINLAFNFPVTIQEIQKHITLSLSGKNLDVFVNPIGNSERMFHITLRGKDFTYDTLYSLVLSKGIIPKYGNIPLERDYQINIKSKQLLDNISSYRNILSSTGAIIDTKIAIVDEKLATNNLFFNLNFLEEVNIYKSNFSFVSIDGENIDFELLYNKEEQDGKKIEKDNKKSKNGFENFFEK